MVIDEYHPVLAFPMMLMRTTIEVPDCERALAELLRYLGSFAVTCSTSLVSARSA